jgi:hypothetical protein
LNGTSYHSLLSLPEITLGHEVINLVITTGIFIVIGLLRTVIAYRSFWHGLPGFAAASGLPVLTVLMLQVVVISAMFFPYQNFSDRDWNAI